MSLRQASLKDAKALFALEQEVFADDPFALSYASLRYHLKRNRVFVSEEEDHIVAYALFLRRKNYYRLYSLAVAREFRGRGIAQELLEFSFAHLPTKNFSLEVKLSNPHAIRLYEKLGFLRVKILKEYYPDGDGLLMQTPQK